MALTTDISLRFNATLSTALDLATASVPLALVQRYTWTSGVIADTADKIFHDTRTLVASATEDLDLSGVLTDALGATVSFAKVKAVIVTAAAANTNNVQVIRTTTTGIPLFMADGDGIPVVPGGMFAWVAPNLAAIAVTNSTDDTLTFTNSAGSTPVTYNVVIVGTSA